MINSVCGNLQNNELGITLMHEHIMCNDSGADYINEKSYDKDEVVDIILPYLKMLKNAGCKTLVDSTPPGEGRDVDVLKELSKKSGLNIITNTGAFYGKGVSKVIRDSSINGIIKMWEHDFYEGIDGTSVKPGFIKIALDDGPISSLQEKILRAAARTSLSTNLTIQCHAIYPQTALQAAQILKEEGLRLSKFIWAHIDSNIDLSTIIELGNQGMWLELDSIGSKPYNEHAKLLNYLIQKGMQKQLLLSQDSGWYNIGEKKGGEIKPYHKILTDFLPVCIKEGLNYSILEEILTDNPGKCLDLGETTPSFV